MSSQNPAGLSGTQPPSELLAAFQAERPALRRALQFGFISSLLVLAPTWYMMET